MVKRIITAVVAVVGLAAVVATVRKMKNDAVVGIAAFRPADTTAAGTNAG